MERRTDYRRALLIEAALHDAALHDAALHCAPLEAAGPRPATDGRAAVARRLAELGVPLAVAVRVLTRPLQRRQQTESPFIRRES